MTDTIITGIFTVGGIIIGSSITYLGSRERRKIKEAKSDIEKMSNQIKSYWHLEKLYSEELSKLKNLNQKKILEDFRTQIQNKGLVRPTFTENETEKILDRWN